MVRARQGTGGRASHSAGTAAMRKRSAVSWGGDTASSAIRVATNARPQITATSSARTTWRPDMPLDHSTKPPAMDKLRPRSVDSGDFSHSAFPGRRPLMAHQSLKIDHILYLLTLDGERRIIQDGAVLVENGRISRVGKAKELADARADRVIDGRAMVVTPGFFNGHMHISYAHPVRGIFPDEQASPLVHVFNLQSAMTEDEEYHATLLGLIELVKSGTVCFLDPGSTKFPDACLQAYEDAGIRVILGECVTDQESPWALPRFPPAEAVARTEGFISKWNGKLEGRLRAWAMPFSYETCSTGLLQALKSVADEHRTGLTLHHNTGEKARQDSVVRYGHTPTAYLQSIGVIGPGVLLAHCLGIDEGEIDCIARTGTTVAMCPVTAAKSGRGVSAHGRMPELLARGVRIALGCDSPNNSNHL